MVRLADFYRAPPASSWKVETETVSLGGRVTTTYLFRCTCGTCEADLVVLFSEDNIAEELPRLPILYCSDCEPVFGITSVLLESVEEGYLIDTVENLPVPGQSRNLLIPLPEQFRAWGVHYDIVSTQTTGEGRTRIVAEANNGGGFDRLDCLVFFGSDIYVTASQHFDDNNNGEHDDGEHNP